MLRDLGWWLFDQIAKDLAIKYPGQGYSANYLVSGAWGVGGNDGCTKVRCVSCKNEYTDSSDSWAGLTRLAVWLPLSLSDAWSSLWCRK